MLSMLSLNPRPLSSARVPLSMGGPHPHLSSGGLSERLHRPNFLHLFFVLLTYFGVLQEELAVWMYLDGQMDALVISRRNLELLEGSEGREPLQGSQTNGDLTRRHFHCCVTHECNKNDVERKNLFFYPVVMMLEEQKP